MNLSSASGVPSFFVALPPACSRALGGHFVAPASSLLLPYFPPPPSFQDRLESSGRQIAEGSEPGAEFAGTQRPLTVEPPEKVPRRPLPFRRIAFHARRDEVAVGITPELRLRHHVIDALHALVHPPHAIKTAVALACVDGLAQQRRFEKDRKSTRLNSSHLVISYAVFCLKKKKKTTIAFYNAKEKVKELQNIE